MSSTQSPATTSPISLVARVLFVAGSAVSILMALAHGSSHFMAPVPSTDDERTLTRLMEQVPIAAIHEMTGQNRTYWEITRGFSWHYSLSYLMLAVACLALRKARPLDLALFRFAAFVAITFLVLDLVISFRYFFVMPQAFTAAALLCFVLALFTSGKLSRS